MEEEVKEEITPRLIKDLGMRYSTEKSIRKYRYGLYECQYCGQEWEVLVYSITSGRTNSCGCMLNKKNTSHGFTFNRFYSTWNTMLHRCNNHKSKGYKNYGARGITVCVEWLDVVNFVVWAESTYIDGYTLDRIDVNGNYEPSNCRWADITTQALNKRMMKNNTSGFVGIAWSKKASKWRASICVLKINKHIGYFDSKEEAVQARDNYIIKNNLPHKLSTDYKRGELKCNSKKL